MQSFAIIVIGKYRGDALPPVVTIIDLADINRR
jgi:hypothetical protein